MSTKVSLPEPSEPQPGLTATTAHGAIPVDFESLVVAVEARIRARKRANTAAGRARARVTARLRSPGLLDDQLDELSERIGAESHTMRT
jgi:hypothetical protein